MSRLIQPLSSPIFKLNFKFNLGDPVTKVTMLEFRRNAQAVLRRAMQGNGVVLTYRGKPVLKLEPIRPDSEDASERFYRLGDLAVPGKGKGLSNREIDRIIYEE